MIRTTDNNQGNYTVNDENDLNNLNKIGNRKISELELNGNSNLLVFPPKLGYFNDDIEKSTIFDLHENKLTTNNIMGFVGVNNTQLTINSRFDKNNENDYFLHYMLQKVFALNIFQFDQTSKKESIWDFLIYMFPYYLKKALAQGIYKEYRKNEYNDTNIKGAIDVSRHIKTNIPFRGKIAYNTREHSYDNSITQLIRHTIEYIKTKKIGKDVLNSDNEIISAVNQITFATPTYSKNNKHTVVSINLKPFRHPYFSEYRMLQKICIQILRYEKMTFGDKKDKIYGLLFDGAWLWEEYLNTILTDIGFKHPQNKTRSEPIYLFSDSKSGKRYPDFYKENIVLDAKYKRLEIKGKRNIDRNDMNQIISYMYILKSGIGGFVFPSEYEGKTKPLGTLNGYGGDVHLLALSINQNADNFESFCTYMIDKEENLKTEIETLT